VRDRLKRALQERECLSEYDAVIVNRDVKDCVEQIAAIVRRSRAEAKGSDAWRNALARLKELLTRAGQ
jgi:guanylate kinase